METAAEKTLIKEVTYQDGRHAGWSFFCPACEFLHVYDDRWTFNGDQTKPTFSPSLRNEAGPGAGNTDRKFQCCHLHVTNGQIVYANDSTHAMVGRTVPMEPF